MISAMYAEEVLALLKTQEGLSVREISDILRGNGALVQITYNACRWLEDRALIERRERSDGKIGHYLAGKQVSSSVSKPRPALTRNSLQKQSLLTAELLEGMARMGRLWAKSAARPRVQPEVEAKWEKLIDEWAISSDLPLVVRKSDGVRGASVIHHATNRMVIRSDNSPAQWAFFCAMNNKTFDLEDIRRDIKEKIPFSFAAKAVEKGLLTHSGNIASCQVLLGKQGWKLCHCDPVGLRDRKRLEDFSIDTLVGHFKRLMKPSNHFLVPLEWAGFGEIPEVIEEIRKFERRAMDKI